MSSNLTRMLLRCLAGFLLVFFLTPFASLSCSGRKMVTLNGFQVATGTEYGHKGPMGLEIRQKTSPPEPFAILAGLMALATLGLAFSKGKAGLIGPGVASGLCALSLLIMKNKVERDLMEHTSSLVIVQWEFGFWLMFCVAIACSVLVAFRLIKTSASL